MIWRDGDAVRLFTRNANDWSSRFPGILQGARAMRSESFLIDGDAILSVEETGRGEL
jgi:ATP-dependent DNA ligase